MSILAASTLVASLLLAACASTGPAPVEDLSVGARRPAADQAAATRPNRSPGHYRVQRGDTLYSIAFRNGVDFRELAAWNHIEAPYTIYVGQELRVVAGAARAPAASTPSRTIAAVRAPAPARSPAPAAAPMPPPFQPVASPLPAGGNAPPPAPAPAAVPSAPPPVRPVPALPPAVPAVAGELAWRWPADGAVTGTYVAGDQTRQGIDIAGKAGDPVRAAADGTVVYSGNGLIGYGELIIVKHSPVFLSAYGHNRKRLVKEGDRVMAGQTIAEMGSSSANRDSLHFEIRKSGKPVNPIDYLPRR